MEKRFREVFSDSGYRMGTLKRFATILFAVALIVLSQWYFYRLAVGVSQENYYETIYSYANRLALVTTALGVDLTEVDTAERVLLRPLFDQPLLGSTGYPFLLHPSGYVEFHFFRAGQFFPYELMEVMGGLPNREGTLTLPTETSTGARPTVTVKYISSLGYYVGVETDPTYFDVRNASFRLYSLLTTLLLLILLWLLLIFSRRESTAFHAFLHDRLLLLSQGGHPQPLPERGGFSMRKVSEAYNAFLSGYEIILQFTQSVSRGDRDAVLELRSSDDKLGHALLDMQKRERVALAEQAERSREDEIRNWHNQGLTQFAQLLRDHSENIDVLAQNVIRHLVTYLGATQGGLFILEERESKPYLRLAAAFAYGRKKHLEQRIALGEGLVGTCAVERDIIHLDDIPPDYCNISSGIGYIAPRELLLVPLKTDDALLGVVEMASLNAFEPHMVEFAMTLSGSVAQTFQSVQSGFQTAELLRRSQEQEEMMRSQEEEMRQNLEEMQATQEELMRQTRAADTLRRAVDGSLMYAELSSTGEVLRGNKHFEDFLTGIGDNVRLGHAFIERGHETFIDGGEGEALSAGWSKLEGGEGLRGFFVWKGHGARLVQAFIALMPEQDARGHFNHALLLGYDCTGLFEKLSTVGIAAATDEK